jgi:hypothetical protein
LKHRARKEPFYASSCLASNHIQLEELEFSFAIVSCNSFALATSTA